MYAIALQTYDDVTPISKRACRLCQLSQQSHLCRCCRYCHLCRYQSKQPGLYQYYAGVNGRISYLHQQTEK